MDNGKYLIVAEKPSVANLIASALSVKKIKSKNLDYFENDKYLVTSAQGHLIQYDKPKKKWDLDSLPLNGPDGLSPIPRTKPRLDLIKKLAKRDDVTSIVNACDAAREGELIFNQIMTFLKINKPFFRAWLQSMTKDEILKEFQNLKSSNNYEGLANAALARSIADWKIGMNGTRAVTAWSSRTYNLSFNKQVIGRVKTPTLAIIVNRDDEIDNFIKEKYFQISAQFNINSGSYEGYYVDSNFDNTQMNDEIKRTRKSDRIFDDKLVNKIISECNSETGVITESKKQKKEYSEPLFDLTTLQRESNSRFGFTASTTLKIAQSLYQPISGEGFITYPRTDSRRLPDNYNTEVENLLNSIGDKYSKFSNHIIENKLVKKDNKKIFDSSKVSDHFAIIPTSNFPSKSKLNDQQEKIYDLIVKRFLAVFYPPTITDETTRDTVVNGHTFRTRGKILIDKGWKEVLDSTTKETILNNISDDEEARCIKIDKTEHLTNPKPKYTDSTLLRAMETAGSDIEDEELVQLMKNKGLGTPATRAQTIEDLIKENYIMRTEDENDRKCLMSTIRGKKLIQDLDVLEITKLTSPDLTGEWELKLKDMEQNGYSYEKFINEIEQFRDEIIQRAKITNVDTDKFIKPLGIDCPITGLPIMETFNRYTTDKPDESFNISKVMSGRPISKDEVIELVKSFDGKEGKIGKLNGFVNRRFGTFYDAFLVFTNSGKCELDWGQNDAKKDFDFNSLESLGSYEFVNSEVRHDEKFYYFGKKGEYKISKFMLSPYLNSYDEEEQKKESLPIDEAKKIFAGEKTSVLQFKSKKKTARRPFFKAKVYLDKKFIPKFEIEKISNKNKEENNKDEIDS